MRGEATRREILSQPDVWASCLAAPPAQDEALKEEIRRARFDRLLVTGCGSSYYLALLIAGYLRTRAAVPVDAHPAGEIWLHPDLHVDRTRYLAICVSRSGRTSEVLHAREILTAKSQARTVALTCTPNGALAQVCDHVLSAEMAQEESVVMTRSFTTMFLQLARAFSDAGSLASLPARARTLLTAHGRRMEALGSQAKFARVIFLASGSLYGFAREAALKVEEMSLTPATAYHVLEFRHGPIAVVEPGTLAVCWLTDAGREQERRVAEETRWLGAEVVVIGGDGPQDIPLSGEGEALAAMPLIHLLALGRALARSRDPDRPRTIGHVVEI